MHKEIALLNLNGFNIDFRDFSRTIRFDFYGFLGDTAAKSLILNITGQNGTYGCPYCFIQGIYFIDDLLILLCLLHGLHLRFLIKKQQKNGIG